MIRSASVYQYDKQLRPGEIGVDFEDVQPDGNGDFTKRYDPDVEGETEKMVKDILNWVLNG